MDKKIAELIEPTIKEMGYSLKKSYFKKESGKKSLIVVIDSEDGIGINDCAKVSRKIDPILEDKNISKDQYYLIVSSPGEDSPDKFL